LNGTIHIIRILKQILSRNRKHIFSMTNIFETTEFRLPLIMFVRLVVYLNS